MAATKDLSLQFELGDFASLPLASAATVYRHTAIGQVVGTNTFRALVAGDKFAGIAMDGCVNASGGSSTVFTRTRGVVIVAVTGASSSSAVGVAVYASADDTFTLTSSSNSLCGRLRAYDSVSTKYLVEFNAALVA